MWVAMLCRLIFGQSIFLLNAEATMGLLGLDLALTKSVARLILVHLILYACNIYNIRIGGYTNSIATSQNYMGVYDEEKGHSLTMPM